MTAQALPRFGMEGPSHTGVDVPHWDGLRAGELRIQRCAGCRRWIWGPQPICPTCHAFDPGWEAVEPSGVIYSWTRTWQRFHPTAAVPYTVVLVELPHAGGRRVFGMYAAAEDPVIGARVRGEFEPAPDDHSWPLVRWHPEGADGSQSPA